MESTDKLCRCKKRPPLAPISAQPCRARDSRPIRILPGIQSPLAGAGPGDLDWVIVRENSEGEYSGHGGRAHKGLPEEVGTEASIFTRVGVTRIMRYAFRPCPVLRRIGPQHKGQTVPLCQGRRVILHL